METKRYFLIINNIIIRDLEGNPILEIVEDGKSYYSTAKGGEDLTEYVNDVLNSIIAEEQRSPMFSGIAEGAHISNTTDKNLLLRIRTTPLYDMQVNMLRNPDFGVQVNAMYDLAEVWEKEKFAFLCREFVKYSKIMNLVEQRISRMSKKDFSIFAVNNGKNKVMNVLHATVHGIFNPYSAFPELKMYPVIAPILDEEHVQKIDLDSPYIFLHPIMRGEIIVRYGTSYDILKMMGVDHKLNLTAEGIHLLLAACVLKLYFVDLGNYVNDNALMDIPLNETIYFVIDPNNNNEIVNTYFDLFSANQLATQNDYVVHPLDFVNTFVKRHVLKMDDDQTLANDNPIVRAVRSAQFVQ